MIRFEWDPERFGRGDLSVCPLGGKGARGMGEDGGVVPGSVTAAAGLGPGDSQQGSGRCHVLMKRDADNTFGLVTLK